jgi:hypothetical protein
VVHGVVREVDVEHREDLGHAEGQEVVAGVVLDLVHEEALAVAEAHREVAEEAHQEVVASLLVEEGRGECWKEVIGNGRCYRRQLGYDVGHIGLPMPNVRACQMLQINLLNREVIPRMNVTTRGAQEVAIALENY